MLTDYPMMTKDSHIPSGHTHDILVAVTEYMVDSSTDEIRKFNLPASHNEESSQSRDEHLETSIGTSLEELFLDAGPSEDPEKYGQIRLISVIKTDTHFSFTVEVHQSQVPDCTHDIMYLMHDAGYWKMVREVFDKGGFEDQIPTSVGNGYWLLTWGTGKLNAEEESL